MPPPMQEDVALIVCPYCMEELEVWLEPELEGSFVQDCEVCCNPWQLTLKRDYDGDLTVDVRRAQ